VWCAGVCCAAHAGDGSSQSLWHASNPSKRWTELFYLAYSPFWILWALCVLVPFQLYEVCVCLRVCVGVGRRGGRVTACTLHAVGHSAAAAHAIVSQTLCHHTPIAAAPRRGLRTALQ
jgi:hypothetical protein